MAENRKSDEDYGLKTDVPHKRLSANQSIGILLLVVCLLSCALFAQQAIYHNAASRYETAVSAVQVSVENSVSVSLAAEEVLPTLVNINTADVQTLCTLKGIGEAKANAIIEYRTNNGPFTYKEELMKVSGIGEKTFAAIEAQLVLSDENPTQ